MERERTQSRADLVAERFPERVGGDVLPFMLRIRGQRAPATHRTGFEDFVAALPRIFAPPSRGRATGGGREIAKRRWRATLGDDAA